MLADLERLINLQQLDDFVEQARRTIAEHPDRVKALEDRLNGARDRVAGAKQRTADNQTTRRTLEKDLAALQTRLSKYKDQLMEVKTNREYQAMQKEIEVAQAEVGGIEDRILERMVEADDLGAGVKKAEAELVAEQKDIERERREMDDHVTTLRRELDRCAGRRDAILSEISPGVLAVYQSVASKRRGIGVAEARGGICSVCQVRLRPQVFNDALRNDMIIQCESCQRILYSAPAGPGAPSEHTS
jgi:predicted  nucleic acid-binding Zn-ribbon protein